MLPYAGSTMLVASDFPYPAEAVSYEEGAGNVPERVVINLSVAWRELGP